MRSSIKLASAAAVSCIALASALGACSGTGGEASGSGAGAGAGAGAETGTGTATAQGGGQPTASNGNGGDLSVGAGFNDGGLDPDSACVGTSATATLTKKPVDIIFIIDNSGSMGNEIEAVQANINANFASIIGASGIDYRVIMIAAHGSASSSQSICVSAPLSGTTCSPIPAQPANNPPTFYQYGLEIGSHDSFCKLLKAYDGTTPDAYGFAPKGWSEWLRQEAFKVFVEITDDGTTCSPYDDNDNVNDGTSVATKFDTDLLAKDPLQFGDAMARNYVWHSIVGLTANATPTDAWQPGDPMVDGICSGAVAPGTAYQALSILTGGLRFPICENASFDSVFQEIAKGVIEGAKVECEFPIPPPPQGETIDISTVVVQYTPDGTDMPQSFKQVTSADTCAPGSFYIEDKIIKLCPDACSVIQADPKAKIAVLFGCASDVQ